MTTGTEYRIQKAEDLLTKWAFLTYLNRGDFEYYATTSGGNILASANTCKNYNPAGFKTKVNAKQDRPQGKSKPPTGAVRTETIEKRVKAITKLLATEFSPRAQTLLFMLFLPRSIYKAHKLPIDICDRDIALICEYSPQHAKKLKAKAIYLVALHELSPVFDDNKPC
jgi:hypothetical protein